MADAAAAEAFRSLQLDQYHELFLSKQTRADGRQLMQFRDADISMNPVETADGSCCVRFGNSCVMCGSKLLIQAPDAAHPDQGLLDVSVKLPPNSLYKYKWNKDAYADEEQVMESQIRKLLLSSECLDLSQLVIESASDVWQLSLEVICLDFDGNIMDVAVAAVIGCLMCTQVPLVLPDKRPDGLFTFTGDKKALALKRYPLSSTYAIMGAPAAGADDGHHALVVLADATVEEDMLSSGSVSITTSIPDKNIVRLHKDGGLPMEHQLLFDLMSDAEKRAELLHRTLSSSLHS